MSVGQRVWPATISESLRKRPPTGVEAGRFAPDSPSSRSVGKLYQK